MINSALTNNMKFSTRWRPVSLVVSY